MEWLTIFYVLHIIGIALGVGGATVSDFLFLHSVRDRKISSDEFSLLSSISKILWTGLALLIFSGTGMLAVQYFTTGSIAMSGMFLAKMTIVLVVFLNGLAFKKLVFPVLAAHTDRPLHQSVGFADKLWTLSIIGAISIVSWYSALLLGALRTIELPYVFVMTFYVFLVSGGAIFGYLFLSHLIFTPRHKTKKE